MKNTTLITSPVEILQHVCMGLALPLVLRPTWAELFHSGRAAARNSGEKSLHARSDAKAKKGKESDGYGA